MIVGGYQISNALVAILLVASTTGAGVATDSFSGLDDFTTPLSDPSENITDVNETDTDDSQDSSGEGTQDSSSDGSSDSDSGDSGGSDQDSPDSSDNNNQQDSESEDSSDEEGGFLDNILGNEEENSTEENSTDDSVDQVDDTENVTDDNTTGTGTEGTENDTDSTQNDTTTAEIISFSAPRDSQFYDPYESTSVPLEAELTGNNVEYEVVLNGETNTAGSFSGTETINTSLTLSDTGSHEITLEITQSGSTVNSITRTFEIADSAIQQTGFSKTTTIRTGSEAGFRLLDNGEPVDGASISLDGTQTANTNADGEFTVQVPYQETITLSTDHSGIESQTFNVTQDIPEPDTTLIGPNDLDSFDTPTGTNRDVTFEASVEITEDSGTASLMIDGSEAYTQDLSSGTNSISTTQGLAGGSHTWQVKVDTPEHNVSSSSRGLTVNEVEVQNGLSLQNNATAGEYNYVRLYDNGEPVEGTDITVNGDSIGTTDSNGEVGFEVPNVQEITVEASGYDSITQSVEGYEDPSNYSFDTTKPLFRGFNYTLGVQKDAGSYEDVEVFVNGVSIGTTDSSGDVEFEAPYSGSINISINTEGGEYSESVDTYPLNFDIIKPENGGLSQDYGDDSSNIDINSEFEIDAGLNGDYKVYLDGNQMAQGSVTSGQNQISETLTVNEEGTYELFIEYTADGKTVESYTSTFDVEWVEQPFMFDLISPVNGESIDDYEAELNFNSTTELENNYDIAVKVDGETISSDENIKGDWGFRYVVAGSLESGSHEWVIEATDASRGRTITSEVEQFETTVEPPVANASNLAPEDGSNLQNDVVEVDIRSYEDLEYSLVLDGSTYETKTLSAGNEGRYSFDVSDLSSGSYNWYIDIQSTESSKSNKTETWSFTVG